MADLEHQLREDRALRNAAKGLVTRGIGNVKGDMAQRGFGARIAARARDGAAEIADNSAEFARGHRGQLGAGLAVGALAVVGWMFRERIADAVYNLVNRGEDAEDENIALDPGPGDDADDIPTDPQQENLHE